MSQVMERKGIEGENFISWGILHDYQKFTGKARVRSIGSPINFPADNLPQNGLNSG